MVLRNVSIVFGSISLATIAYVYYVKRCYKYLKSLGYDGPSPQLFVGNLLDFASKENSVTTSENKPVISHYSKTLRRWTKVYGKIYGFYEGHSPVLVLADPDLVTDVFVNQNKLVTHRRSFPMSKSSSDPNADIFISNGIRWLRVRYGLEKIMLNTKNTARCLEYCDEGFISTFKNHIELKKSQTNFDIYHQAKLLMIQTMFLVIFGADLNNFIEGRTLSENDFKTKLKFKNQILEKTFTKEPHLYHTRLVAHKFSEAFEDFESFSLLKFIALMIPELGIFWRSVDKFKRFFNTNIFPLSYFADPMDWFYSNFINKHLILYIQNNEMMQNNDVNSAKNLDDNTDFISNKTHSNRLSRSSRLQSQSQNNMLKNKRFCYFNSFLFLTYNPIIKYHQNESPYRRISVLKDLPNIRKRDTFSSVSSYSDVKKSRERLHSLNSLSKPVNTFKKQRHYSTDYLSKNLENEKVKTRFRSTSSLLSNDIESEDFENWKLSINEALSNTLLMFFAGYETTSSTIGFCCKVLATLPEQREKLLDEIKENWNELSFNLDKYNISPIGCDKMNTNEHESDKSETEDYDNDEVFEDDKSLNQKDHSPPCSKISKTNLEEWNDLYEILDKMKYLDMFVREVLRMFPIASSMVSRKCAVDDLYIGNGNYYIPKNMNIVVDVLSIHYDPVLWGPVDPEVFYPERFLTERDPAAWLAFGVGSRKCLGVKLAMSQIKLFVVRLLQNFSIDKCKFDMSVDFNKFSEIIETKDILFNSPIGNVNVSIDPSN